MLLFASLYKIDIGTLLIRELKKGDIIIPEEMSYLRNYSSPTDFRNRAIIYAITPFLIPYVVPYNSKLSEPRVDVAFSWDDVFMEWLGINSIPAFDPEDDESIREIVKTRFTSHNKSVTGSKVQTKLENTSKFLIHLKHIQRKRSSKP